MQLFRLKVSERTGFVTPNEQAKFERMLVQDFEHSTLMKAPWYTNTLYLVASVVERRTRGGKAQSKVRWLGFAVAKASSLR